MDSTEPLQRAAACVPPVVEPPGFEKVWIGHRQSEDPGPGNLALFCQACPQPGINLPEGWEDNSDQ